MPKYTLTPRGKVVPLKPKPPGETKVQISSVYWFDAQYPRLSQLLFHIANGGKRNAREAMTFKRMGVRRGIADLFLSIPNDKFHGMYIEMKCLAGKQSVEQQKFERSVAALGYKYVVCDTLEKFISAVQQYLSTTQFHHKVWGQLPVRAIHQGNSPGNG